MYKLFLFIIAFPLFVFNYSCSPTGILASGGASTMVIAEGDKSLGETVDDASIKIQISAKFLSHEENLFLDIETTVIQGRVLLTGIVDTQELRIAAVKKVWEVEGVVEVINEIEVGESVTLSEYSNDLWISTQARGLAVKNLGLRGISYNFETIRGKIYVAGITSKKEQLDTLIESIKKIKGVKEIVNYVVLTE
ncbi:MAG: hypothetical protein CFH19_00199 [Alphaproteobacteria bacterium MarineAlpha5_Bin9]|nr:MAG: hypothetical protein CFH19_00199 [Alphaproteobacteria bacterium MarineAlpha5_Bin9]|tara:strand:- start:5294 stop:5875 length:582 start_codon:yes stop_codon:yes gene_type:complete